ncbi:universal stress protein [Atopobacter phocae]|uniref:universal stress protein n=1 Tax=Atopobacter phocae TaxID=136492 RepID=UPI0004714643|nr:universal stress protein [Atopobacter phocae]
MKKIIVAFDGSEHAIHALNEAKKLQIGFPEATITVLEVFDIHQLKDQDYDLSKSYEQRQTERLAILNNQLRPLLDNFEGIVLLGDPAAQIINHINTNDYDLLVIGTRGLNALQELVLGSVSHNVIQHIAIPTLVVK